METLEERRAKRDFDQSWHVAINRHNQNLEIDLSGCYGKENTK